MEWGDLLGLMKQFEESIKGTYIVESCPTYWVDVVCKLIEKKFECKTGKKQMETMKYLPVSHYEILAVGISQEKADQIRKYAQGIIDSFKFLDEEA